MSATCPLPVFMLGTIEIMGVPTTAELIHACGAPLVVSIDVVASVEDLDDQATQWVLCCTRGHRLLITEPGDPTMPNDLEALADRIAGQLDGQFAPRPVIDCARCHDPISSDDPACTEPHDEPRHLRCCAHGSALLAAHTAGAHLLSKMLDCPACRGGWA